MSVPPIIETVANPGINFASQALSIASEPLAKSLRPRPNSVARQLSYVNRGRSHSADSPPSQRELAATRSNDTPACSIHAVLAA